ncbi:MAG: 6-phosphogluconolactonase [Colwelliaceae bacterium]|nr:6-phosphogluconolactonase [Colwelliaceae bacterium]|tara:strand:- start:2161 stop:2838 length:678 start_codon:yes stop_codon:yes gene_type:complete
MNLIKGKQETLEKKAIKIIELFIREKLKTQDYVTLGIPGGASPLGIFTLFKMAKIDWRKVHIFMVDERFVPLSSQQSNFKGAEDFFIKHLVDLEFLPKKNVHPFVFDQGIGRYAAEFKSITKKFDLVILGMGSDGHTASIFPNHPSSTKRKASFLKIENSPKLPKDRMSASLSLLAKSDLALLLVWGEDKKPGLDILLDEKKTLQECPARIIYDIEESYILTDIE